MKLAFLGLGRMGLPIASRLIGAGHEVVLYNRTRSRAESFGGRAEIADSPAAAARGAAAILTMLADDAAVRDVVYGPEGFARTIEPGAIHVSMSTISVALSRELAGAHAAAGQSYAAAPVFGRPDAAEAGKLWIVAAGRKEVLDRCQPLFTAVSRGHSVIGEDPWLANVVKIGGNFLIASMLEALGEAFALTRKHGVEAQTFLDAVNSAVIQSPLYAGYGTRIAQQAYSPAGFLLRLGLKDVKLALEAAGEQSVPMPLASLIRDHCLQAIAHGDGEIDWSALAEVSAGNAGL